MQRAQYFLLTLLETLTCCSFKISWCMRHFSNRIHYSIWERRVKRREFSCKLTCTCCYDPAHTLSRWGKHYRNIVIDLHMVRWSHWYLCSNRQYPVVPPNPQPHFQHWILKVPMSQMIHHQNEIARHPRPKILA